MAQTSLRKRIINMEPGQALTMPVVSVGYSTLRNYASELGYLYLRKYSVSLDREARTITITRNR